MLLRQIFEAPGKRAVLAFGRLNPPTIGHAKLVETIKSIEGDHYLFLSHTQKPKTDPLDFATKLKFAKQFFPGINIGDLGVKTPVQALELLQSKGYTDIVFVAGSDRVEGFQRLFDTYNGQADKTGKVPFKFNSIKVVSAGERDPDADDVSGMSASKMRALAAQGELESFAQGVPDKKLAKTMYDAVRQAMGVKEDASPEEEDDFHTQLDKLVHKYFGHSSDEKKMKSKKVDEIFGFGKKAQMRRGAIKIAKDVVIEQIIKPALTQFKGAFEGIDIKEDKGDYLVTGYGFKIHLDVAESHLSPMVNKESRRPTYYIEGDLAKDLDSSIKAKYKAWTEANKDNIHSKMITMPETMSTFEANNKTKDGYYEQNIVIRFRILDGDINKKFK